MTVKLTKKQFDYLSYSFSEKQENVRPKLQIEKEDVFFYVNVDETSADEIRDWANEELQKKGFDINYKLTYEGKILEELIDAFYI